METPPPYVPSAPKKSNTGLIIGIVLAVCAVCCIGGVVAIGGLGFLGFKAAAPMIECTVGMEETRTAILAYAQANDGKLPNAATWQQDIRPHLVTAQKQIGKDRGPFKALDPSKPLECVRGENPTGIAYNASLSGKKLADIQDKRATVLIFEAPGSRMNFAEPYKPQDPAKRPTMFGEPREWFVVHVEGQIDFEMEQGKKGGATPPEGEPKAGETAGGA